MSYHGIYGKSVMARELSSSFSGAQCHLWSWKRQETPRRSALLYDSKLFVGLACVGQRDCQTPGDISDMLKSVARLWQFQLLSQSSTDHTFWTNPDAPTGCNTSPEKQQTAKQWTWNPDPSSHCDGLLSPVPSPAQLFQSLCNAAKWPDPPLKLSIEAAW